MDWRFGASGCQGVSLCNTRARESLESGLLINCLRSFNPGTGIAVLEVTKPRSRRDPMKKLNNKLKRMLNGLAYQDAGEYLPMREKMDLVGYGPRTTTPSRRPPAWRPARASATRRIALISDARGADALFDYAIDVSSRQHAAIDLLIHGVADTAGIAAMVNQVRAAGLEHGYVRLGLKPVNDIVDYIYRHPSLGFLLATPEDKVARTLIEEVIPKRRGRIPVPLVLIGDQTSSHTRRKRSKA